MCRLLVLAAEKYGITNITTWKRYLQYGIGQNGILSDLLGICFSCDHPNLHRSTKGLPGMNKKTTSGVP